jgi:hypothetical protein
MRETLWQPLSPESDNRKEVEEELCVAVDARYTFNNTLSGSNPDNPQFENVFETIVLQLYTEIMNSSLVHIILGVLW